MKLEDLIKNNKELFEDELPKGLWQNISKEVKPKKYLWFSSKNIFRYAAGLLICVGFGYYLGQKNMNQNTYYTADKAANTTLVSFSKTIEQKREKLDFLKGKDPELYASFMEDLSQLEESFKYLKLELDNNPNQDQVLDAMKENLKLQIDLLNKQTQIAEKFELYL